MELIWILQDQAHLSNERSSVKNLRTGKAVVERFLLSVSENATKVKPKQLFRSKNGIHVQRIKTCTLLIPAQKFCESGFENKHIWANLTIIAYDQQLIKLSGANLV